VTIAPVRRPPPEFRVLQVRRVEPRTPSLVRVSLGGPELAGFAPGLPAASVRLLLPQPSGALVMPTWNGNEFLFDDGTRPPIRTLTPLRHDAATNELDVEIVRHGAGPLSEWVDRAGPGACVALSGPGRGYLIDPHAPAFLIAGDECALPAITTLIPELPPAAIVHVVVEVADPMARLELPPHTRLTEQWCTAANGAPSGDALHAALTVAAIEADTRVWVAGEAAAMQRIRKYLFEVRSVPRDHAVVRGYWKG
jgi:NADPH-dependent ferric siderophore reductase